MQRVCGCRRLTSTDQTILQYTAVACYVIFYSLREHSTDASGLFVHVLHVYLYLSKHTIQFSRMQHFRDLIFSKGLPWSHMQRRRQAWARGLSSPNWSLNSPLWNILVKNQEVNLWNFQILTVSAFKICKQCLHTASASGGRSAPDPLLGLHPLAPGDFRSPCLLGCSPPNENS